MYIIVFGSKFDRQIRDIAKRNKKFILKIQKIVELLEVDIKHPSLRLHKLSGTQYFSISVDKSVRILMTIEKNTVFLLKIGKHEEVY